MHAWLPRPIDLAVAAVLTIAAQVELWAAPLGSPAERPLLAVSYAVATAAVAWHRTAPVSALATVLTGAFVVPLWLDVEPSAGLVWLTAVLGVIASAGYHARRPLVALATALLLLAVAIALSNHPSVADVVFAWLMAGAAWVAGRALAGRTLRAELSEARAAAAEQAAQWKAAAAVTDERLRIAREMHDVVSHSLSVITLHVSGVRRLLRPDQVEERKALETAERTGRESIAEMHRMLGVLRTSEPATPAPGLGRLEELLDPARAAGLTVHCSVTGDVATLPPGPDLAAYRIVQEAVTNVLRHAQARTLECTVVYDGSVVDLRVADDGPGGPPTTTGGHGLVGMRERAAAYGGVVETGRGPTGFTVHAVLPVSERADAQAVDAP